MNDKIDKLFNELLAYIDEDGYMLNIPYNSILDVAKAVISLRLL